MLTKDDLLNSMIHECNVIKHLAAKVPSGRLDWRPTPGQRSILETLRYLSFCAAGAVHMLIEGNWDWYQKAGAASKTLPFDSIERAMDDQIAELRKLFESIPHKDFVEKQVTLPDGSVVSLGRGILDSAHKWLTGYKMQLFLFEKEAGNDKIGTWNCWRGKDKVEQPA
ncbi:MAG: DinB family protein [Planctomycetes bacterium]|nr:DinB family protein [Planctomycetota bacterium]NUQ34056.1 hypothetical protein [Planctomycetaceae bacterium]